MLRVKNTLTHALEELSPQDGKTLQMYVCGITPYDNSHLGHARTFVSFDIMRRWIIEGHKIDVNFIENVTDVEDKIIKRAEQKGVLPLELAQKYDNKAREEFATLNIMPPTTMPKISEHIPQTIEMIKKLIDAKFAYKTKSGIYYEVAKFPKYGQLSGQKLEKIRAGARIEVDENKKSPEDFALWKFGDTPGCTWDSPWGKGRPGWHIECSAMSMDKTGGKTLDLHCGARDLIFPHHENEIAQSDGAGYDPFCRIWVHTGFLTVEGEKMAKSLGNFITIEDALKKWEPDAIRLFFTQTHYSSPVDFSKKALEASKNTLENIRRSITIMQGEGKNSDDDAQNTLRDAIATHMSKFSEAMDNDFDTPSALSELILASKRIAKARAENRVSKDVLRNQISKIRQRFAILGLKIEQDDPKPRITKKQIEKLVQNRQEARENKDWEQADKIREELKKKGVIIEDSKEGIRWRFVQSEDL